MAPRAAGCCTHQHEVEWDREQDAHLSDLILEASPDIIYVYDRIEQRYSFVSKRIKAVLGYTPDQVQRLSAVDIEHLIHPDDLEGARAHYAKQDTLRDEEVSMTTYRVAHAEGDYRVLRCRQKVFSRTRDGRAGCILGVATDITKQLSREREIDGLRKEILRIRDDERRRIALQMHDTAIQHLVGASLLLKGIEKNLSDVHATSATVGEVQASLSRALHEVLQPLLA